MICSDWRLCHNLNLLQLLEAKTKESSSILILVELWYLHGCSDHISSFIREESSLTCTIWVGQWIQRWPSKNPEPSSASKWGTRKNPQFYVKDGKNYNYLGFFFILFSCYTGTNLMVTKVKKEVQSFTGGLLLCTFHTRRSLYFILKIHPKDRWQSKEKDK